MMASIALVLIVSGYLTNRLFGGEYVSNLWDRVAAVVVLVGILLGTTSVAIKLWGVMP